MTRGRQVDLITTFLESLKTLLCSAVLCCILQATFPLGRWWEMYVERVGVAGDSF